MFADAVATGRYHGCALGRDGEVYCWGANLFGQLGRPGQGAYDPYSREVSLPQRAVALSAGAFHTCAILSGGTVWCWGLNNKGQLGDGTFEGGPTPRQVFFPPGGLVGSVIEISAGWAHTCVIAQVEYNIRRVFCWGDNSTSQLGVTLPGGAEETSVPTRLTAFGPKANTSARVVHISAGVASTCARDDEDVLWCWGQNTHGQLGDPAAPSETPLAVRVLGLDPERRFLSRGASSHVCVVDEARELQCWGSHSHGQLGSGDPADTQPHYLPEDVVWQ
jgi:alpha-tubulin suppressor-like RCC1 family protein